MKTIFRSMMLVIAMFAFSTAFADTPQQDVNAAVQEAALECSNGEISAVLDKDTGVVTINGQLDCALGRSAAEKAAMEFEYVKEVINLITVN